jgi:riboflavin synthase
MIYGQRVDGHLVSGHIDRTAKVFSIDKNPDTSRNFSIHFSGEHAKYCIYKGSIAINGVSLTIASIEKQEIANDCIVTVCLIPYTWEHTNLSSLQI